MTAAGVDSGLDTSLCNGTKRQPEYEGETCKRPAGWGTAHPGVGRCKLHGGSTRNHAIFAEMETARQTVALWGGRRDIHPAAALLELVQDKAQEVIYWKFRVSQIAEEDLLWGTTKVKLGGDDYGTTEEAKPHAALVQLREAERDLRDFCVASLKAGVEASLVAVEQAKIDQLSGVIRLIFADPRVTIAGDPGMVLQDALKGLAA